MSNLLKKSLILSLTATVLSIPLISTMPKVEAFNLGTFNAIMDSTKVALRYEAFNQVISYVNGEGRIEFYEALQKRTGISDETEANELLSKIMNSLTDSIAKSDSSVKKPPYNYYVNGREKFNAFSTLGHNLTVNIGVFKSLNYNEDEIAVIVAHELAHGQRNHPSQAIRKTLPVESLGALDPVHSNTSLAYQKIVSKILDKVGTSTGYNTAMEKDAAITAFQYITAAGYNAGAPAATWQKISELMHHTNTNFANSRFNPSNSSAITTRINTHSRSLTFWSNQKVAVNPTTGMISVNNKPFFIPTATDTQSSLEQAYLIAGNLAAVYHSSPTNLDVNVNNNILTLSSIDILDLSNFANPDELVETLNKIK